jgi:predicted RNA-binding protein associated with RNAse of E/G family
VHPVREQRIGLRTHRHRVTTREFPIEELRVSEHGLYLARRVHSHPRISFMASHYLPGLGIIASKFTCHDGTPYLEWYVDVAETTPGEEEWIVRDYYLDIEVTNEGVVRIVDTDEYLAALAEGHLSSREAEYALTTAHQTLNGILAQGTLEAYLASRGVDLST